MQRRDPKPEIQRLEELALAVRSGDIKLPKFQRPFVWKRMDMIKLLDSIYKGYPIGSLLIWNSSQRLTSERSISGLTINSGEFINYPTNYLLDGQQRLTTLCGALFWDGLEPSSQWNIHFDLEREEFGYPKEPGLINLFPLNRLIETSDFIKQCMKFEHHEKGVGFTRNAEKLLRAIKDYKIAVVKIGDMTVEEVAPIFERINSTGRKLTIVDLMMAATWSDTFDLNATIQEIAEAARVAGFSDLKDQFILRSISAAAGNGINKEDIQRLRKLSADDLLGAAKEAMAAVVMAISFLRRRMNIQDFSRIPYALQFTHLVEYFRLAPAVNEDELASWMWFTSVTRYFASANSGQNSKDLLTIREFATGRSGRLYERGQIDVSRLFFDKFNLRNSSSTSFVLLLSSQLPSATIDEKPIDEMYLSVKDSKFYTSLLQPEDPMFKSNIARVIHPYPDRPRLEEGNAVMDHLLPEDYLESIRLGGSEFVVARANLIAGVIRNLTQCEPVYALQLDALPNGSDDAEDIE